jgi:hypothetical protein
MKHDKSIYYIMYEQTTFFKRINPSGRRGGEERVAPLPCPP